MISYILFNVLKGSTICYLGIQFPNYTFFICTKYSSYSKFQTNKQLIFEKIQTNKGFNISFLQTNDEVKNTFFKTNTYQKISKRTLLREIRKYKDV